MPDPGRKITVQVDEKDKEATVEVTLVEEFVTKEGGGQTFVRRRLKFNNTQDHSRTVAVREVTHQKRLPDDLPDDPDQKIKAFVVMEATTEEGSGPSFRRRIYKFNPDDDDNHRRRHDKRIKNKTNPFVYLDIRRKDQFITVENSGLMFKRRLTSMAWDDKEEDNAFDKNDLIAEPVADDPTAPILLDFLQDVVNVGIGPQILAITWEAAWQDGPFNAFARAPRLKTPSQPNADPPLPAHGDTSTEVILITSPGAFSVDGTVMDPENPITEEMVKHLLLWQIPGEPFLVDNTTSGTVRNTTFINLAKFKPKAPIPPLKPVPSSVTFKIDIPELPTKADWYRFIVSGFLPPSIFPPFGSALFEGTFEFMTADGAEAHRLLLIEQAVSAGNVDVEVEVEQTTNNSQTTGSWSLKASTYGARADYPIDTQAKPKWDFANARSTAEASGSGGPFDARTITLKLDFPTLKLTLT